MSPSISSVALLVACVALWGFTAGLLRCGQVIHKPKPKFHLIRHCTHSQTAPVASDRVPTVEECSRFAIQHRALAFNFVSPKNLEDEYDDTCLVYECPELNPSTLQANSLYDYYGVYSEIETVSNLTCVPTVGMFQLHLEMANFSEAAATCDWEGGQLARVISPQRTNQLSALVATLGSSKALHLAYVGLHDIEEEGSFITIADEPLNCFEYRGWAPGEPRSRKVEEDCVVLDSRQSWRVVDCGIKLPFLCELVTTVPDPCGHIRNKRYREKCLADAEMDKIMERKNFQKCKIQQME